MLDGAFEFWQWLRNHPGVLWWSGALSLAMFVGTLVVVPILLVEIPADYFTRPTGQGSQDRRVKHLMVRWTFRVVKNLLGVLLVLMGLVLLVLPGQGLLTILLGVSLLDLPGKRRLEIALLRRPAVSRAVNWLRRKSSQPPLEIPRKALPAKGTD